MKEERAVDFFKIDEASGIPIWLQVKNGLLHMILTNKFAAGDQLPTVRELAVILSINYNTVSKVYAELEREGFIVIHRGRGTFVADKKDTHTDASRELIVQQTDEFIHKMFEAGLSADEVLGIVSKRLRA